MIKVTMILASIFAGGLLMNSDLIETESTDSNSDNTRVSPEKEDFIVHEWGTFTSLHSSEGDRLDGLFVEEEQLPAFVYEHAGLPDDINDNLSCGKGLASFAEPMDVTIKMETPVLYFYSDKAMEVDIKVDFPRGTISQWYPQRTNGDVLPEQSQWRKGIDFSKDFNGWIKWNNIQVLGPDSNVPLSPPVDQLIDTWKAPRAVRANKVKVGDEVEKYLFYRGLGNFDIPVHVKFNNKRDLQITNTGTEKIPYVFVYQIDEDGNSSVYWTGDLDSEAEKVVTISENSTENMQEKFIEFAMALKDEGLYLDEAKAMLETWKGSYFKTPGLRVFWILPEKEVDRILPLDIKPKPRSVERVFVGRCDVLTPKFEEELVNAKQDGSFYERYKNHRYYIGYNDRLNDLMAVRN